MSVKKTCGVIIPFSPLIIILFFRLYSATVTAAGGSDDVVFINQMCNDLQKRSVNSTSCRKFLLPLAGKFEPRNNRGLVMAALNLTISQTNNTARNIAGYISRNKTLGQGALGDRKENLDDTTANMVNSRDQMKNLSPDGISNIQTWLSTAVTDESTCMEGFNETRKKVDPAVTATVLRVAEAAHIVLALFNQFANVTNP